MNKIFFVFHLLSIFFMIKSKQEYIDELIENYDKKYEESLKNYLKKYLIENNLFESDKIIKPEEFKKIFIKMMLEGSSIDEVDDYTREITKELANIFIEKYYKKKKEIRGKDIYDLININDITQKYYQLNGEIPIYDDDNDGYFNDL